MSEPEPIDPESYAEAIKALRIAKQALMEVARIKGRNPAWVDHVLAGREAKRRKA